MYIAATGRRWCLPVWVHVLIGVSSPLRENTPSSLSISRSVSPARDAREPETSLQLPKLWMGVEE